MPPRHVPPARRSVASSASVQQNTSGRARGPDVCCSTNTSTGDNTGTSTNAGTDVPIPPGQRNSCGNAAAT